MHRFRAAIEAGDVSTIGSLFADDVVLNSPIAFRPYNGRETVAAIVSAAGRVFEGFGYEKQIGGAEPGDCALVFHAAVGDLKIQGCDFVHTGTDGLIDEITVMLRPLKAVTVFAEKMRAQVAAIPVETQGV